MTGELPIASTGKPERLFASARRGIRGSLPETVLVLTSTAAGLAARGSWVDPVSDAGTWWSTAYRLANGERLYRDVYLQFGPLSPYLLAFGAKLFGASAAYIAMASWVCAIGASLLLLRASRPFLTTLERLAVVGLVFALALFPAGGRLVFPYAPGAVHALLFALLALLLLQRAFVRAALRAVAAGALAGLAFCAKQEIGLACLAALAAPVLLDWKKWSGWALRALLGFSLPVMLGAVLALSSAPLESLRYHSRLWPLASVPPHSWLKLYRLVAGFSVPDWDTVALESLLRLVLYLDLFAIAGLLIARDRTPARWRPVAFLFIPGFVWWAWRGFRLSTDFHPVALTMTIAFGTAIGTLFLPMIPQRNSLLALSVFAGLLGTRTAVSPHLSGPYSGIGHFASSLTWMVFLCVIAPRLVASNPKAAAAMRLLVGITLIVFSWTAALGAMRSLRGDARGKVETRQGNIFVNSTLAPFFRILGRRLEPGERVWVLPEINGVDALYQTQSVSPYPSQLPGWLDGGREEELLSRIKGHPPDAVILFRRDTWEYGVAPFGQGYDRRLAKWIYETYLPVETTRSGILFRRTPSVVRK